MNRHNKTTSRFSDLGDFPHAQGSASLYFKNRFAPAFGGNKPNTKIVQVYTPTAVEAIRKAYNLKKKESLPRNINMPDFLDRAGKVKFGILHSITATAPKAKRAKC